MRQQMPVMEEHILPRGVIHSGILVIDCHQRQKELRASSTGISRVQFNEVTASGRNRSYHGTTWRKPRRDVAALAPEYAC